MELKSQETGNGAVTVTIKGEIDMSSSPKVRELLNSLFKKNQKAIVVDLSGVTYIDSSGIATLVEGLQWSHNSHNKFRLTGLTPMVKDVFEIARLLTVFEIFDTWEEALQGV
ncbi:MAG: anti-sigma factor antagonist [Nitrospinaceae bacterium]|nr:STAS domain-containing protein [Nitrospinaceae bacterium]NIR56538.1 STAS domain-containing protein [Nitrospinaceae bacterium]NIS86995.1 STAS domain-containing protein [Nitrospinaceae bacterium]NIT83839.1 STAS domain-containing protein [Nitrospinaceae bacterium]NIU46045.1 STAS domain-containing protein [Nitrospinaceae bacterium]